MIALPEQEARAYPVAPGNSITFKDESQPYCYVKTMGFNQLDRPTFERYRLVKEDSPVTAQNAPTSADSAEGSKDTAYALKSDLGAIWSEIDTIKEKLRTQTEKKAVKTRKATEEAEAGRRCVAGHGRTHGSATPNKQAALQRNNSQNSRLAELKGEPEKSGSFFFWKIFIFFYKKLLTFSQRRGIL